MRPSKHEHEGSFTTQPTIAHFISLNCLEIVFLNIIHLKLYGKKVAINWFLCTKSGIFNETILRKGTVYDYDSDYTFRIY